MLSQGGIAYAKAHAFFPNFLKLGQGDDMNWKKTKHPSDQVIAEYDYTEGTTVGGCVMHYRNLEGVGETYLAFDVQGDPIWYCDNLALAKNWVERSEEPHV